MKETENKSKSSKTSETLKLNYEDILIGFRKFGWLCALISVVFGLVMFVHKRVTYVPHYTSSATFHVSIQNSTSSIAGVSVYSFYYNSATANQISKTFPYILQSDLLYDAIR